MTTLTSATTFDEPPGENGENIGVVIQGPTKGIWVNDPDKTWEVATVIESVRRFFPKAYIVLSTWQGSDVKGMDFDKVIHNEDPGTLHNANGCVHNFTRQLISTQTGLDALPKDCLYSLKLRTDTPLSGRGFLDAWGRYNQWSGSFRMLRRRIIGLNLFTRHPRRGHYLFCWSDLVHFGLQEDVKKLWSVPMMPASASPETYANPREYWTDLNLLPEQYLWSQLFREVFDISRFTQVNHREPKLDQIHDQALANHFIPLPLSCFGVQWPGRTIPLRRQMNVYGDLEYEKLYRKICDPTYRPSKWLDWVTVRNEVLYLAARLKG